MGPTYQVPQGNVSFFLKTKHKIFFLHDLGVDWAGLKYYYPEKSVLVPTGFIAKAIPISDLIKNHPKEFCS